MVNLHRDGAWPGTKVDVESEVSTRLRNQTSIPTRTIHGPVTDERISTELGDGGIIWEERNLLNPSYGSFLSSVLFRLEGDVSFLPFFFYFFESEIKIEILRDTQGEVAVLRRNNVWRMREFSRERYESFVRQRESIRRVCYQGTSFGIAIGTEDLCCVCTCFVPRSFIHLTQRCMGIRMVLTLRIRRGSSFILLHSVSSPLIHTKIIS